MLTGAGLTQLKVALTVTLATSGTRSSAPTPRRTLHEPSDVPSDGTLDGTHRCTANCAIEGANAEYASTYGVHASGAELTLSFVTDGPYSKNVGSRVYLLEDEDTYHMFKLKN